jgi:hypothetical protein
MTKKILLILFGIVIIYILMLSLKNILLYHPYSVDLDKYKRFYHKIGQLTQDKNNIVKKMVKTPDDFFLDTIYLKNNESKKCIIYFHGNAGNISMRFEMVKFLYNYSSVIIFDYRSYGMSSGYKYDLSEYKMTIDAETIWNYAIELGFHPNQIGLYGESLGCAVITNLARELSNTFDNQKYPYAIVLTSPFYSLESMIERMLSRIDINGCGRIISILLGQEYMSAYNLRFINYDTKIIIAHSRRDEVVPYIEGLNLHQSISTNHPFSKFYTLSGTHNNLGLTDDFIYALADLFYD